MVFFFFFLIYLFSFGRVGLYCFQAFSSCSEVGGDTYAVMHGLLTAVASLVAEQGL